MALNITLLNCNTTYGFTLPQRKMPVEFDVNDIHKNQELKLKNILIDNYIILKIRK